MNSSGCGRMIRTSSWDYETHELPLLHHRNILSLLKSCSGLLIANWTILALEFCMIIFLHTLLSPLRIIFRFSFTTALYRPVLYCFYNLVDQLIADWLSRLLTLTLNSLTSLVFYLSVYLNRLYCHISSSAYPVQLKYTMIEFIIVRRIPYNLSTRCLELWWCRW